ncbi:hypothetical protein H6G54_16560 [Anabaena cylindrica FACHB-243]|nr:hypothetical protein [Anabaena cylindrica FACHB-243]MBY5281351.1 hypothetical protein [Anabaena sp. CCAP 1446/1C]MBY5308385.1 hypothetical protein [Anabaena sp. CCAP 1446/1C]
MRFLNMCINTVILSSQYNPPRFIELLMLSLAIAMLGITTIVPDLAYLVLGLSFVVGASISILVREWISTIAHANPPSPQRFITQLTALLLLGISIYGFADLIRTL